MYKERDSFMTDGIPSGSAGLGPPTSSGDWAGWSSWTGSEPFEEYAGPFYAKRETGGGIVTGFRLEAKNMNGGGAAHGGALVTFADYSLFMIAIDHLQGSAGVTVSLNSEFLSGPKLGALLTCRGDVVRGGKSLIFVRGLIDHGGAPVLNFSGVIKKLRT
jgi:acyl-coenzyme A thioesterase PaaI-like protein